MAQMEVAVSRGPAVCATVALARLSLCSEVLSVCGPILRGRRSTKLEQQWPTAPN